MADTRRKQPVGTKYDSQLDHALDANQDALVDLVVTPHVRLPEFNCSASHKITAKVAGYNVEAQPTQARGKIVWSRAYDFQTHGPTFLDPVPDSATVPYAK
jgi:hypothetical protein